MQTKSGPRQDATLLLIYYKKIVYMVLFKLAHAHIKSWAYGICSTEGIKSPIIPQPELDQLIIPFPFR